MTRPRLIGLTGGIGAGKSEALAAFAAAGAETVSSDAVVHELLATGELRDRLVERWGREVAPGGEIDREQVAAIVFERPEELAWLESELHPRVGERIARWAAGLAPGTDLGVVEVPLLFEAGMEDAFDATVCVIAPEEQRNERAKSRGHAGLTGRGGRQLAPEEKAARADHVIENDGSLEELRTEVSELATKLASGSETRR